MAHRTRRRAPLAIADDGRTPRCASQNPATCMPPGRPVAGHRSPLHPRTARRRRPPRPPCAGNLPSSRTTRAGLRPWSPRRDGATASGARAPAGVAPGAHERSRRSGRRQHLTMWVARAVRPGLSNVVPRFRFLKAAVRGKLWPPICCSHLLLYVLNCDFKRKSDFRRSNPDCVSTTGRR